MINHLPIKLCLNKNTNKPMSVNTFPGDYQTDYSFSFCCFHKFYDTLVLRGNYILLWTKISVLTSICYSSSLSSAESNEIEERTCSLEKEFDPRDGIDTRNIYSTRAKFFKPYFDSVRRLTNLPIYPFPVSVIFKHSSRDSC